MSINKRFLLSIVGVLIFPIAGFFISVASINMKNKKNMIFVISMFVFFVICLLPPYQDLYRRYLDTYYLFNNETTLSSVTEGHIDVLFYLITFFAKKLYLPFYVVPALLSSMTVYFFLNGIFQSSVTQELENKYIRFIVFFIIAMLPIVQLALGVRWGSGVSLAFYGVTNYIFLGKRVKSIIYLTLAVLMHFSMILVLVSFVFSILYKLNRGVIIILSILGVLSSNIILPLILSHMGNVGTYATVGYTDNEASGDVGNLNGMLVSFISICYFSFFLIVEFANWKKVSNYQVIFFRNFVFWFFIMTTLVSFSYVPFKRYITGAVYYYIGVCYLLASAERRIIKYRYFIICIMMFSFLFNGVYLQRRALLMGHVWDGLLQPVVFLINYSQKDYDNYLKQVDEDGDWVKDKLNVN